MPDNTQDMRLTTFFINSVTHGFTVDGHAFVCFGELFVPALQRKIELFGIDANQGFSERGATGYIITAIAFATAKTGSRFGLSHPPSRQSLYSLPFHRALQLWQEPECTAGNGAVPAYGAGREYQERTPVKCAFDRRLA